MRRKKKALKFVDISIINTSLKDKKLNDVYLFHLEKAHKQFRKYKNKVFKEKGINLTSDQWVILKTIHDEEGCSQIELAKLTFKEPASITRTLDLLEEKGWVNRKAVNDDRRTFELVPTKKGKQLVAKLTPIALDIRAKGLKGFTKNEKEQLNGLLIKLFDNFKN